ncbi:MAG TPA: hypothetical protein VHM93_22975 [Candidatus Acidoferrum sp.]|jgi:formate hydrogenlyase subunit 3/multisubunit Na+/H+ antiporter MnhD subunit|nr:hypothetical protein [Candidatus Acidoferrum sp.]
MGFLGKFYVLAAGAWAAAWALILILVLTAGLFYYLRIVVALYSAPSEPAPVQTVSPRGAFVVVVLAVLLIYFGVYASPLLNLIRTTMAGLDFATQIAPHYRSVNDTVPVDPLRPSGLKAAVSTTDFLLLGKDLVR